MGKKLVHCLLFVKEGDDGLIASSELFILVISPGIVYGTAVEDEAATITAGIVGYATAIGKAGYAHC